MIISSSNGFKCVIQTQQYWQLLIWTYIEKGPNWIPQNAICCNNVMLLNITYPQTCYLMLESWKQTQFYPGLVGQQSLLYKNVHVLLISRLFWSWTTENKRFSSKKKHKNTLASFHGCSMASLMKKSPPETGADLHGHQVKKLRRFGLQLVGPNARPNGNIIWLMIMVKFMD